MRDRRLLEKMEHVDLFVELNGSTCWAGMKGRLLRSPEDHDDCTGWRPKSVAFLSQHLGRKVSHRVVLKPAAALNTCSMWPINNSWF